MRTHVLSLSANTSLLRHALPVLVRPYNKSTVLFRTTAPNRISFLRSTSQTTLFRDFSSIPPKRHDVPLFTTTSLRTFTSRATHVNDAGSFDLPLIQSMQNKVSFPLLSLSCSIFIAHHVFDHLLATILYIGIKLSYNFRGLFSC